MSTGDVKFFIARSHHAHCHQRQRHAVRQNLLLQEWTLRGAVCGLGEPRFFISKSRRPLSRRNYGAVPGSQLEGIELVSSGETRRRFYVIGIVGRGATQGFRPEDSPEVRGVLAVENVAGYSRLGGRSLALRYRGLTAGRPNFIRPSRRVSHEAPTIPERRILPPHAGATLERVPRYAQQRCRPRKGNGN